MAPGVHGCGNAPPGQAWRTRHVDTRRDVFESLHDPGSSGSVIRESPTTVQLVPTGQPAHCSPHTAARSEARRTKQANSNPLSHINT